MSIRTMIASIFVSVTLLASGTAMAAVGDQPIPPTFEGQLAEAKAAAGKVNSSTAFYYERNQAIIFLKAAESLASQGSQAKAQDFLNFARGKLGLGITPTSGGQSSTFAPSVPKYRR